MRLDIKGLLDKIKNIPYIIVKIKVPYVPGDFPDKYAVGKDLDILVLEDKLLDINNIIEKFAKDYEDKFNIVRIFHEEGFRIRFQDIDKLHFQIDVSYGVSGIKGSIIKSSIVNRQKVKNYFVALDKYEMIYRYFYYQKKKKKKYHLDYILKNILKADESLLKEIGISFDGIT